MQIASSQRPAISAESAAWIPVAAVAELLGISDRAVRDRVQAEGWEHRYAVPEGGGRRLEIALAALPEDLRIKYLQGSEGAGAQRRTGAEAQGREDEQEPPPPGSRYETATAVQRAEADRRLMLLQKIDLVVAGNADLKRSKAVRKYIRLLREQGERRLSVSSYYAWRAAYAGQGVDGLVPDTGAGGRKTSLAPADRALFLQCWGTEARPSFPAACLAFDVIRKRENLPGDPPSRAALRYLIDHLSAEERLMLRSGPKAIRAALEPYIERDWEGCLPLEWFVMDHSPLDILALDDSGRLCRPYLTALMDMGTRRVCVTVCRTPNQNTVLWTLAKAILAWGRPENLYVDNGKDFRAISVTGGKRKRFTLGLDEGRCRSLCARLGTLPHFAINFNAQAKPIERWFRTLEGQVATLFETYVGRSPQHKPEALQEAVKKGPLPTFRDVEAIVTGWIEGVYHRTAHTGRGMNGKTPDEAWAERIGQVTVRGASREELKYLLLKTAEPVTISRYQVRLFGRSYEAAPDTPDCLYGYHGQKVWPHFDPRDITRVFLTLEDDTPVGWVVEKRLAAIGPTGEDVIVASNRERRKVRAALRTHLADVAARRVEPDRVIAEARRRQEQAEGKDLVGNLPPAAPPGRPRAVQPTVVSLATRAAAKAAANPPARPARREAAQGRDDFLSLVLPDEAAGGSPRPTPKSSSSSDEDFLDLIMEGSHQ